ncbi:toll/interleukin-1 receptor domain-containing protein [Cryobacterium sp. TMT1-19]|uniref:toll/interleukin-1 receptor domain-containing protein n=1 Tax=Cryobacterium sp. TMT1-19 TaxID=1259231 RepID=UPI00106BCA90|nr:toll/interleukin-1 receptor domain-containing protein [Cryobacterium sp. TMT1-19]TFD37761.1 toll/interleukin-1 receptor domain-containing protein [Cryobacterium sp. TMT1-19]
MNRGDSSEVTGSVERTAMAQRTTPQRAPLRVFCSYAHKDYKFSSELHIALSGLRRLGLIETWDDENIKAGDDWDSMIRAELERADVIIFLVSYECCESDYVMDVEFQRAEERLTQGLTIIPLVVTEVDYPGTPFKRIEGLLKVDKCLRPIDTWKRRREAYSRVAQEIRRIAETEPVATTTKYLESAGRPTSPPHVIGAPERREVVVGRMHAIGSLASKLVSDRSVALVGSGGVGKTTVALEYTWQYASRYNFVAWLRAENSMTLGSDCARMAMHLGLAPSDDADGHAGLRQWLETNEGWLLVFDNATDVDDVRGCLPAKLSGSVIITSRKHGWTEVATEMDVDRLSPDHAAELLMKLTGDDDAAAAADLADLLEGRPLALQDTAAAVKHQGDSLRAFLREYRSRLAR